MQYIQFDEQTQVPIEAIAYGSAVMNGAEREALIITFGSDVDIGTLRELFTDGAMYVLSRGDGTAVDLSA